VEGFKLRFQNVAACLADRILCISVFISAAEPPKRVVKMLIEKGVVKLRMFFENSLVAPPVAFMVPPSKKGSHAQNHFSYMRDNWYCAVPENI